MSDRKWRVLLAAGMMTGVCAIGIALVGGSHFTCKWASGQSAPSVDIRIGPAGGVTDVVLEAASVAVAIAVIIALMLGSAHFALSRRRSDAVKCDASASGADAFSFMAFIQNLRRSAKDCQVAGICGGLGEHSPIPSWVWRIVFLVLLCVGVGFPVYMVLWICLPEALRPDPAASLKPGANSTPGPVAANGHEGSV